MTRLAEPACRVSLRGDLTAASGEALLDAIRIAAPRNARRVLVDCSGLTRLDGDGVSALLDAYVATALRHGTLALTGLTWRCRAALAQAGVLDVIEVVEPAPSARFAPEEPS